MPHAVAPSVRVSQEADDAVQDHEQALCQLAAATDAVAISNAYGRLCERRKALYAYLAQLERTADIPPTVVRRF